MAEPLNTEEDIANYLTLVLEEGDMSEFNHALNVVARARGMTAVAEQSGLTREALQPIFMLAYLKYFGL